MASDQEKGKEKSREPRPLYTWDSSHVALFAKFALQRMFAALSRAQVRVPGYSAGNFGDGTAFSVWWWHGQHSRHGRMQRPSIGTANCVQTVSACRLIAIERSKSAYGHLQLHL